jgi:hypothetical protein
MTNLIILTSVLVLFSIKSIGFLKNYITLWHLGFRSNGKIIAFEESRHIITKGVIPKVEFQTYDNQLITGKPIYSWFMEVNYYIPDKSCVTFYDKVSPNKFIIKSNVEFLINFAVVIGALISLLGLIIALA